MKHLMKLCVCACTAIFLQGCATVEQTSIVPAIVPQIQKTDVAAQRRQANIIGAVEPIYFLPMKSAFEARIDTGATTSSIDAQDIDEFERDGEKWVSFKLYNRRSGETHIFEKPVIDFVKIKRTGDGENRFKVSMDVKFGGQRFAAEFTLAQRDNFEYQGLVGRNILTGRAVVDTALSHTLK